MEKSRFSQAIMAAVISILLVHIGSAPNAKVNERIEAVVTNLEVPWAIDFLPDDTMIFTERPGRVKTLSDGTVRTIAELRVTATGEAGLLGLAVDPEFSTNRYVYLYYTYAKDGLKNRVSRFTLNVTLGSETVLLDDIPGSLIHNGGRVRFGPDGLLYVTTGDASNPELSGNPQSLAGKILRLKKDGSVPEDNPFGNYVYATGLRNPQGIAWHDGVPYATDHGPSRHDAIRRIERGMDYGWPRTCEETSSYRCYTTFTLAPSGIASSGDYLYVAGLRGNQLRRISLTSDRDDVFLSRLGRLRAVTMHKGMLYISTSNRDGRGNPKNGDDRIIRIDPQQLNQISRTD